MPERITRQLLAVLAVFLDDPSREWYGLEVLEQARLKSGTLYPILHRLVDDGWLIRTRETRSELGGTGRRLYRLTAQGEEAARSLLAERRALKPTRRAAMRPGIEVA
ncbi:MAG TPA: helix-turn-helix transcriptional regulator [Solirubrobacteraceae bacterium]|jgi:DNA-binding PadR family transcriptional regulator